MLRKTAGMVDVLGESLSKLKGEVDLAFVFGSLARGEERTSSDIDVAVIGSASFQTVVAVLSQTQEQLRREINPVVMTRTAFRDKYLNADRFVSRVMKEPKLFIVGSQSDLTELAGDRPA